jgi:hypothetical protein
VRAGPSGTLKSQAGSDTLRFPGQVAQLVERSPEKAGVGGSIPSLATLFSITYISALSQICSILFQFHPQCLPDSPLERAARLWESTRFRYLSFPTSSSFPMPEEIGRLCRTRTRRVCYSSPSRVSRQRLGGRALRGMIGFRLQLSDPGPGNDSRFGAPTRPMCSHTE